ncbi:MAG: hypothetical protein HYR91_05715 [Flavobacteriia bacterium]|nr:hypothetical protein [Flavobacteriia bacterium]
MKIYPILLTLLLISCSCQNKLEGKKINKAISPIQKSEIKPNEIEQIEISEQHFRDSLYNRESKHYISKLEEIPNTDSNAYKLTISLKNGEKLFSKVIDTRPQASQINYCNDLYTVVGFACGGPCYSQVFVFTDENRPMEQYDYGQKVKNNPNFIAHIRDEEFKELVIHNFKNSKELVVDISDNNFWNYGQMDSIIMKDKNLFIYYINEKQEAIEKVINLKSILK